MNKVLTIKVAAYNVQKYIRQCLDPFKDKRYRDDLQVIIVNNRCGDNTLDIISEYEKEFPTVFRIIAQENEGYASTFNRGFEFAEGKYFTYIDGDDWYENDELYEFIKILKTTDCDLVLSNLRGVCEGKNQVKEYRYRDVEYGNKQRFDEAFLKSKTIIGSHSITVKTNIIKENNLMVHKDNFIPEVEYELLIIPYIETVMYTGEFLYNYRTGYSEQASNYNSIKKKSQDIYDAAIMFIDWLNKLEDLSCGQYTYLVGRISKCANVIFYTMLFHDISMENWKKIGEILKTIKAKNVDVYRKMFCGVKLLYWGSPISYLILAALYRFYKKRKKFVL